MNAFKKVMYVSFCASFVAFSMSMNSCKKEKTSVDDFQTDAQDIGQMESILTDVDNMVIDASTTGNVNGRYSNPGEEDQYNFAGCATVTNDSINGILTIDFGTGCTGRDGRTRSGIITITYSGGHYFDPGSSRVVTFTNYFIDGRHVEGTRSITNNGFNSAGNLNWTITASNMKVTRPDGSWQSWNDQRNREMTAGYGDSLRVNDVYLINGSGSGMNSNGGSCTLTLSNLVRANSCHWIVSGTIEQVPSGRPARLIDFGNGSCDDLATATVNGNTRTIHLRP